jgi:hypothetical protein
LVNHERNLAHEPKDGLVGRGGERRRRDGEGERVVIYERMGSEKISSEWINKTKSLKERREMRKRGGHPKPAPKGLPLLLSLVPGT